MSDAASTAASTAASAAAIAAMKAKIAHLELQVKLAKAKADLAELQAQAVPTSEPTAAAIAAMKAKIAHLELQVELSKAKAELAALEAQAVPTSEPTTSTTTTTTFSSSSSSSSACSAKAVEFDTSSLRRWPDRFTLRPGLRVPGLNEPVYGGVGPENMYPRRMPDGTYQTAKSIKPQFFIEELRRRGVEVADGDLVVKNDATGQYVFLTPSAYSKLLLAQTSKGRYRSSKLKRRNAEEDDAQEDGAVKRPRLEDLKPDLSGFPEGGFSTPTKAKPYPPAAPKK